MTPSMLRRQLKNLVQNYSEAEVKVREATSNDPWGPSSSQMADISDLTYNVVACNEIMTMLWKRLKDDKNWRHIHKSLTLLEYLLKTGDDRVLLKMKDNIYIVKALTEYRFVEKDGKDQGTNVREKAKVVLVLMEDDEKLKEERAFAVKTREKTSKSSAAASEDPIKDPNYKPCFVPGAAGLPCLDNIPSVADLTASFAARKEERLKQEAEKREVERRAKLTDDELQWEDAGKTSNVREGAWGTEKTEEEVKTDAWGVPVEPKEATGPWGTPGRPDTTVTDANSEAKAEDPFEAPRKGEDPFAEESASFSASKEDPFAAPKDTSDAFSAPAHKEDPFAAPKDKTDPFSSSNSDPFNAPKDDPFNALKDDPFNALKDDPFKAPKDDPFKAPKDDPFNAPKDDPLNAPKDDPFNAPKDDPFNAPKDDPFNAPKDDPFNAPKDDPFNAPKDDPFNAPKDDPFSTRKDDPFSAAKEYQFNTPKDDPFIVSASTPPKDDPFSVTSPHSPPKDSASDPFSAPPLSSPQGSSDPWEAPSAQNGTRGGDPWGDLPSTSSTVENAEGFRDASKADNDPWGAPAAAPIHTEDAWGSPAPPSDSSPSSDPFGDSSTKGDPWSAPSSTPHNETGKPTLQEKATYRKTASFLGAVGASLVDLDNLFSSYTRVRQRPLVHSLNTQMQAIGTLKASCPTSGAVAGVTHCSPFGIGEENPSSKTPLLQLPYSTAIHSCSGSHMSQMAPLCSERLHYPSVGVGPQVEFNMNPSCGGAGMLHSGSSARNQLIDPLIVETGMSQFRYSGGDPQAGEVLLGGLSPEAVGGILIDPQWSLGSKSKKNNNPFLF